MTPALEDEAAEVSSMPQRSEPAGAAVSERSAVSERQVSPFAELSSSDTMDAARLTHEWFVELVCADEDLLRAEFDAIVAEEWPSPPPAEPVRGPDGQPAPRRAWRRDEARRVAVRRRPSGPGVGGWARQRSPPTG